MELFVRNVFYDQFKLKQKTKKHPVYIKSYWHFQGCESLISGLFPTMMTETTTETLA